MQGIKPAFAPAGVLIILNAARNCSRKMLARVEGQAALEILEIGKTMFKPREPNVATSQPKTSKDPPLTSPLSRGREERGYKQ